MIQTSISYGFGKDNRYKLDRIPVDIQLAVYKYNIWEENQDEIIRSLSYILIEVSGSSFNLF